MDSCYFSFWIETKRKWNVNVDLTLTCNVHVILDMNTRNEPKLPIEVWFQLSNDVQFNVIKPQKKC